MYVIAIGNSGRTLSSIHWPTLLVGLVILIALVACLRSFHDERWYRLVVSVTAVVLGLKALI